MATSFKKYISAYDPKILMIVDALNLAYRYWHKRQKEFVDEYLSTVDSLRRSYKAAKVIITCDQGSSSYRKALYPGYKSGRKEKQELQSPEEAEDFQAFFQEFLSTMAMYEEVDNYPLIRLDKVEADDTAAYITRRAVKMGYKVVLISSDKDWDLLISDSVIRFSYVTRKEITLENWNEHYPYDPDDHISIKCLMGDSGDSVPGVPLIGPKKAHALVQEFGSTYDIIANLPIRSKYKHIANLNEFGAEALLLNYKLMDLVSHCDEAIGEENCRIIDAKLEKYLNDGN
jgi:5'-3' exonuclease